MQTAVKVRQWFEASEFRSFHLKVFLACLMLNTMEGYDLNVYASAIPVLMSALGMSATQAGAIASAASLGTLIGALILGPLADKIGRRKVILASAVLSCASMAAAGLSPTTVAFAASRFAFGFANGGMVVSIMALASEYVPGRSRATLVGMIASGASIGSMIGALLGIWAFPRYGWRPVFFGASALVVLLPLIRRWLPEATGFLARSGQTGELRNLLRRAQPDTPIAEDVVLEVDAGRNKVPLRDVFQDGRMTGIVLIWVCYLVNLYVIHGFSFWLPKLMINRGFTLTEGLAFTLPLSIASIVMTFVVGRIADRIGARPVLAALYMLSCVSIIGITVTDNTALLMFLVGLAGVGFNGAQNMMNGFAPTFVPPPMRSTAMGYNFVCGRVGAMIGPTMIGLLISRQISPDIAMIALALPSILATLSVLRVPDRRP